MRFARSPTIWLLLSLGAAFALLAWSAQRGPQVAPTAGSATGEALVPVAESLAGTGFFVRLPPKVASGVDSVARVHGRTTCFSSSWGPGTAATVTVSPCASSAGRVQLRRLP